MPSTPGLHTFTRQMQNSQSADDDKKNDHTRTQVLVYRDFPVLSSPDYDLKK